MLYFVDCVMTVLWYLGFFRLEAISLPDYPTGFTDYRTYLAPNSFFINRVAMLTDGSVYLWYRVFLIPVKKWVKVHKGIEYNVLDCSETGPFGTFKELLSVIVAGVMPTVAFTAIFLVFFGLGLLDAFAKTR